VAKPVSTDQTWRFGVYEVDTRRVELRRNGTLVKIREQSFLILVYLLEHAGEIVTREELRRVLWPSDTFVDFDHSLNMAVMQLRDALGEATDAPHFIETIPKRGYRFIAPVTAASDLPNGLVSSLGEAALFVIDGTKGASQAAPATAAGRIPHRWWKAAATVLAVGLLASAIWYLHRPLPPLRVSDYIQITHDGRHKDLVGTDGVRLYFDQIGDNNLEYPAQVAISGGEIAQVPLGLPDPGLLDVSPDGSALLVGSFVPGASYSGLWSVRIPGGSLRSLADGQIVSAAWSPDGKSVVYSTGNGDIDVMRNDETEAHRLASAQDHTLNSYTEDLNWSPDGSTIRFTRDHRLWEMSSDGSGLHPLLPGWRPSSWQCCGHWTPDGNFFVFSLKDALFTSMLPGNELWVLDERRGLFRQAPAEPAQLTSGPIRWGTPIPSKDGKKIFARGVTLRGELVRYDAQSNRLQPYLGGISAEFVSFSADGQFLAYVTFPEGILWRAKRDGSNPMQLTYPPLYPSLPRWSPDDTKILFDNTTSESHTQSYIISSQGGPPRPLLPEDKGSQGDSNWSPDGRKIVFSSLDFERPTSKIVIRILDLPSHQITTLPGSDGMMSPRWSPNGRFIAALDNGSRNLKVFDFETQRWSILRKEGTGYPAWSRDGQFIYFQRQGDDPGVFRVPVSGGNAKRVVDLKGFRYTGRYTIWMGLDPTDTPMLIRDVGTDDIYALSLEQK
jgi:DNA-binding winged helix-turn-helix (wHTH) protein/Tol biopolymer transport system component